MSVPAWFRPRPIAVIEEEIRLMRIPSMSDNPMRYPVLTGKKIPGKDPELAQRLRALIDELEEIVDVLDDRYELPVPFGGVWEFGREEIERHAAGDDD